MSGLNEMRDIKFSHGDYHKLRHIYVGEDIQLLEVFVGDSDKLSFSFVTYDTTYDENGDKHNFILPKGKVIILLFMDISGSLFTTIRRYTPKKYEYYHGSRGYLFKVKFE